MQVIDLKELSRGKWLLYLKGSQEDFMENMYIPMDSEFLVVQNVQNITITEFYHINNIETNHLLANWSKHSGVSWQNSTFYGRRADFNRTHIIVSLLPQVRDCEWLSFD